MPSLTPRMHTVLGRAGTEAKHAGVDAIGVEHDFLAILDEEQSIPTQVMRKLGVIHEVRVEFQRILESEEYQTPARRIWEADRMSRRKKEPDQDKPEEEELPPPSN